MRATARGCMSRRGRTGRLWVHTNCVYLRWGGAGRRRGGGEGEAGGRAGGVAVWHQPPRPTDQPNPCGPPLLQRPCFPPHTAAQSARSAPRRRPQWRPQRARPCRPPPDHAPVRTCSPLQSSFQAARSAPRRLLWPTRRQSSSRGRGGERATSPRPSWRRTEAGRPACSARQPASTCSSCHSCEGCEEASSGARRLRRRMRGAVRRLARALAFWAAPTSRRFASLPHTSPPLSPQRP